MVIQLQSDLASFHVHGLFADVVPVVLVESVDRLMCLVFHRISRVAFASKHLLALFDAVPAVVQLIRCFFVPSPYTIHPTNTQ